MNIIVISYAQPNVSIHRLRDDSRQVRKNTLMVLTHLILNDMVKVKGQISELATCIVDDDVRISNLAKLFFLELAKKGNAVYNILPDMVSRLSDPDLGEENFFYCYHAEIPI